jgi:methylenetetrahydrofolate--tRNA-(uracil-5-)-methyltransferase
MPAKITIIGGGLSGSEAALQLAARGYDVHLYEMRSKVKTPAHKTAGLAELVCSNSFKGLGLTSAHGLFKRELFELGSFLLPAAQKASVDAGESLTVDRAVFSQEVERLVSSFDNITLHREEVHSVDPNEWTLVAAGPLCSDKLAESIFQQIGSEKLSFFDAIAPVVDADSVDMEQAYFKNRWDKGTTKDFLNCPLDKDTYDAVVKELVEADQVEAKPFEKSELFEGCLPIEEMARRGPETLRFGPMRPVGLFPEGFEEGLAPKPHAVVQLRAENKQKTLYNLVGFQTRLKWGTQQRILKMVPGLQDANFVRLGCMHRNTFIDAPKVVDSSFRSRVGAKTFFAGQILGAEGYTEAVGTGLYSALQIHSFIQNDKALVWPPETCLGSLADFLSSPNDDFQPMNFNFGLLPRKDKIPKKQKKEFLGNQAQESLASWKNANSTLFELNV